MNRKKLFGLLAITIVILAGAPESLARPQYVANLTAVYGDCSCGTCHVAGSGMNGYNGTYRQQNPNGTYVPRNSTGIRIYVIPGRIICNCRLGKAAY